MQEILWLSKSFIQHPLVKTKRWWRIFGIRVEKQRLLKTQRMDCKFFCTNHSSGSACSNWSRYYQIIWKTVRHFRGWKRKLSQEVKQSLLAITEPLSHESDSIYESSDSLAHFGKFVADRTTVSHFYANKSLKLTENPLSILELAVPVACKISSSYSPLSFNL